MRAIVLSTCLALAAPAALAQDADAPDRDGPPRWTIGLLAIERDAHTVEGDDANIGDARHVESALRSRLGPELVGKRHPPPERCRPHGIALCLRAS